MPVIGLIGEIGAGKSLVASVMAEHGASVLDADAIGHVLLQQRPTREEVVGRFGTDILDEPDSDESEPRIDRRRLGALVFTQPSALRDLEAILHPRMRRTFEKAIQRTARTASAPAVVLDAAILLEAGWDDLCDRIVFVETPRADRLARVEAARGWDEATLAVRERAQQPADRKRARADFTIRNDSDPAALKAAVDALWPALCKPPSRPARPGLSRRNPSIHRGERPDST